MVGVSPLRSGEQPAISVLLHSVQTLELKMRRPASLQDSCALVPCIEGEAIPERGGLPVIFDRVVGKLNWT